MTSSTFGVLNPIGAKAMCQKMSVAYAGQVDLDVSVLEAGENGHEINAETAQKQIRSVFEKCLSRV